MADIQSNWPFERIFIDENEAVYDILVAMEQELDRVDVQADELMEQRFLDTATGLELQKLAGEVGVKRRTNESDESLRYRATLAKAISSSEGTTEEFVEILRLAFSENIENISLTTTVDAPQITVEVPGVAIDNSPLTRSELEDELDDAIPAGDTVNLIASDTFVLGESGTQGIGEGELI
jgi:uncharacterized phage protein gp47/JayE